MIIWKSVKEDGWPEVKKALLISDGEYAEFGYLDDKLHKVMDYSSKCFRNTPWVSAEYEPASYVDLLKISHYAYVNLPNKEN